MLAYQDRITSALSSNSVVHEHIRTIRNRKDGFLVVVRVEEKDEETVRRNLVDVVRELGRHEPLEASTQRVAENGFIYLAVLFNEGGSE